MLSIFTLLCNKSPELFHPAKLKWHPLNNSPSPPPSNPHNHYSTLFLWIWLLSKPGMVFITQHNLTLAVFAQWKSQRGSKEDSRLSHTGAVSDGDYCCNSDVVLFHWSNLAQPLAMSEHTAIVFHSYYKYRQRQLPSCSRKNSIPIMLCLRAIHTKTKIQ